ncbi:MAG: transcriptional regulator, family [Ilumatobacteraceae bacterium]|nr:transcriptional regulator, family [Ilumatobacteraceae bacterium]
MVLLLRVWGSMTRWVPFGGFERTSSSDRALVGRRWDTSWGLPRASVAPRANMAGMPISSTEQRIDLLGPVLIRGSDGVVEVTRRMEIGVLSVLALQAGSPVGVGSLIDVLWPDGPPRTATKTLQGYVKRVRSLLGAGGAELTHTGSAGYSLEIAPDQIDAIRFESTIADARTHDDDAVRVRRLDEALAQWRGAPFAGCDIDGLQPYRERLVRLRSGARVERTAAEIRLGVTADTIGAIRALLADEPTNERLWLHLAGALYRVGNPVAGLRAISEARRGLDENVGVALGPELVELERRILDHDEVDEAYERLSGGVRASSSPSHRTPSPVPWTLALPRWAGPLIGRDAIVDQIAALVDAELPVITIAGPGGIGKTRCGVEAARQAATPCRGFVDLSATATGAELAIHLAGSFGVPDRDDPIAAVAEQLSGARASIVLDNVEQIGDAAGVLRELADRCPNIVWVVTSRRRLGIDAERVVRLDPLGDVPSADGPSAAAALLASAAARRGILIDESGMPGIEHIARSIGGLPLALELAACQLQYLDATAVAKSMDDPLTTLVDPGHAVARHRSMRACFELGFDRLGDDAGALLVLVADRPGGVRHDDLSARWHRDTALNRAIVELVDAGFVAAVTDSAGQPRLVQLPLVRAFGRTCPRPDDGVATAAGLDRLVVGRALSSINATDSATVEPDLPDLRRMMQRGLDDAQSLEQALRVAVFLTVYWWSHRITEGRQWLSSLLLRAAGRPSAMRPHAVHAAAFLDFYVGDVATAVRRLDAEDARPDRADPLARSRLLSLHAMFDAAAGRPDVAAARASEAIDLARMTGDEQMLSVALGNGGDVSTAIGDPDTARARYVESIERLRRAGLEWLAAAPHARLGDLELSDGQTRRARMWFERSITLWSSRQLGPGAPQTLAGLARLEVIEGDLDAARRHLDTALATAKRCGSRGEYPWVVLGFAALMAARGDRDAAAQLFELGLSHGPRAGHHVQRLVEAELAPYHLRAVGPDPATSSDLLAVATPLEDLPQLVARLVGP